MDISEIILNNVDTVYVSMQPALNSTSAANQSVTAERLMKEKLMSTFSSDKSQE